MSTFEERQAKKAQKRAELIKAKKGMYGESEYVKKLVSTGIYQLDKALFGGFPFGKMIEIYGINSSGKCVTEDSYILTADKGYMTLAEVFDDAGLELLTTNNAVPIDYPLVNMYAQREDTTHFVYNNKRKVTEITTKSGFVSKTTDNHPLLILSDSGVLCWKYTKDIEKGDFLACPKLSGVFGNTELHKEEAYLLGLITADGSLQDTRISITNDDPDILSFIENNMIKLIGGSRLRIYKRDNSLKCDLNSKEDILNYYEKYSISPGVAKDKEVPPCIMSGDQETVLNFLFGYLDSEGYFTDTELEVCSASYKLLYQVKLLLSQLDISATLSEKTAKTYPEKDYWRMHVSGSDYYRLVSQYLDRYSISNKVKNKVNNIKVKKNVKGIPNITALVSDLYKTSEVKNRYMCGLLTGISTGFNITRENLKELLDNIPKTKLNTNIHEHLSSLLCYNFEEVDSVSKLEPVRTFDFSMSKTASFIANGIANHNTSLALKAAGEINKINYETGAMDLSYENPCSALFLDLENSFDTVWAKKLGFDRDNYGNDVDEISGGDVASDVVCDYIRDDAYSMIIVDSLDSFFPATVLESDMETNDVGLRAKTLYRGLRRWQTALMHSYKRNKDTPWRVPCILMLNHASPIFMDTYGRTESPGGGAPKFYSCIRISMSKYKIEEDTGKKSSDHGIGKMKAVIKKNKVTGPAGKIGEWTMALTDLEHLSAGEVDNVKSMFADLEPFGLLTRTKKGVMLFDKEYTTQKELKLKMYAEPEFLEEIRLELMQKVI
jgi:recombination protein RecA